jgi:short-subunit dehydrogenase
MVSIKEVRASNDSFKSSPKSTNLTAVFVGATSGIGYSTLRQLAIHVSSPKIYIVGRSLSRFTPQLEELKSLNPRATFEFIEAEVSLLKDVERVCEQLKSTETKLDLLFLSTGFLSLAGQQGMFLHLFYSSSSSSI